MGQMKTPGVYIVEKSAFPNSVVEVATAVPAFIGHTEKADNGGKTLLNKPWRISSMAEYHKYYGGAPKPMFTLAKNEDPNVESSITLPNGAGYTMARSGQQYIQYYCMLMFFQNGGGPCYIVSIGNYSQEFDPDKMKGGIKELIKEQEPTMVVIPEAIKLAQKDCIGVQQASLQHCGNKMKSRIAILDIHGGYKDRQHPDGDCIAGFRDSLGINYLDFASAYYPWVNTTIIQEKDLTYFNLEEPALKVLAEILTEELTGNIDAQLAALAPAEGAEPDPDAEERKAQLEALKSDRTAFITSVMETKEDDREAVMRSKALVTQSGAFCKMQTEMAHQVNLLPPSTAMAGVYTMVDNSRGVWKAPANVSLNSVVSPAVNITHDDQEDLNVTIQGKSINAIRSFIGEGTLVWGARTLDGNSLDWRYINVRRTMIMLEESIRLASKAYVFENNNANTWVTMRSMIGNFLNGIWKRGGLAGATPEDAFSVHVGLGETMTPVDILEGILRITILVAITRPAEFIEITFQQQMQKS